MHGKNGISPAITYQIWIAFVIPRLLHGIELLDIRKSDIEKLEIYQRKVPKQLQTLPLNTPSVAVFSLLGAKEIEANIDANIIVTFLNIAIDPNTVEHQLALCQLTIKTKKRQLVHNSPKYPGKIWPPRPIISTFKHSKWKRPQTLGKPGKKEHY